MLKVKNVSVFYNGHQALSNISIDVNKGEIVSLLGANGAGKTTLLHAIMGIVSPSSGLITLDGEDITGIPTHNLVNLGITLVPEGRKLFLNMTVKENLVLGSFIHRARNKQHELLEEIYNVFPILHERKNQMARTLSGGEQQMLAIGRALMTRPSYLLLDEPSLGLSPLMVQNLFQVIAEINQKKNIAVILVEQNVRASMEISRRSFVLEMGKIVLKGESDKLLKDKNIQTAYLGI